MYFFNKRNEDIVQLGQFHADIWMLGDSIVQWAGVYARQRGTPELNLRHDSSVGWYGIRSMSWIDFIHSLQLRILFQAPLKVIVIHLSRNDLLDIGILPMFNLIHLGVAYISRACHDSHYIWVDVLQHLHWSTHIPKMCAVNRSDSKLIFLAADSAQVSYTCP